MASEQVLILKKFGGSPLATGDEILVTKQTKNSFLQILTVSGLNFHFQSEIVKSLQLT